MDAADITAKVDPNDVLELIRAGSFDETRVTATNQVIAEANYGLILGFIRAGVPAPMISKLGSDGACRINVGGMSAVEGAPSVGAVTFDGATGQPSDGDSLTITDGTNSNEFEFDNDASITGDVTVTIGSDVLETAQNLIDAINSSDTEIFAMKGSAWTTSEAIVWLVNEARGANNTAITDAATNVTVSGMENGVAIPS